MIQVFLAITNEIVRYGLHTFLAEKPGIKIVGDAINSRLLLQKIEQDRPTVLLLDDNLPGLAFTQLIPTLHAFSPSTGIIIFASSVDSFHVPVIGMRGISGCILKDESPDMIAHAMYSVGGGAGWFSKIIMERFAKMACTYLRESHITLTKQEIQILQLIAEGESDRTIAVRLHCSERTTRYYLRNIYNRLGVKNRVGAVVEAVKLGLVV